jgi:DNA-binding MarR family transcriptional regulator
MHTSPMRSRRRPLPTLPERLVKGLATIGLTAKSRPWRRQGLPGMGPLQAQVLAFLQSHPDHRATVSAIAKAASIQLPTASEVIRTLARKQLVRRQREKLDERVVTVSLTKKGASVEAVNAWPRVLTTAAQELSGDEQVSLLSMLTKLLGALDRPTRMPRK